MSSKDYIKLVTTANHCQNYVCIEIVLTYFSVITIDLLLRRVKCRSNNISVKIMII